MKTLFQRDKELCDFWLAIAKQDNFEKVLAYSMAELLDGNLTSEQLAGAKKLKEKLLTIADENDVAGFETVSSGLEHDVLGAYQRTKEASQPKGTK